MGERDDRMDDKNLRVDQWPKLHGPRMVLGFSGWMDGGGVSTGTVEYYCDALKAEPFAEIDPEDFYIYNFPGSMELAHLFRPYARIEDGIVQDFKEPSNTFYCAEEENLVLFRGREPNMHWKAYADAVFSVADRLDVRQIYFIGSVGGLVPHTREPVFWTSMSNVSLRDALVKAGCSPTNYEGPSSFSTYLMTHAVSRGIDMVSCVAGIPSYVDGRNAKCIDAVAKKVAGFLDLHIDFSDLEAEAAEFVLGLGKVMTANSKLAEKVDQLEKFYDDDTEVDSNDDLKDWFERQDLDRG